MTTVSQMIAYVREQTDQQGSDFVTDPEILTYLNAEYSSLYDLVTSLSNNFWLVTPPPQFSLGNGQPSFQVPADFKTIRGLDINLGGQWWTLTNHSFRHRNRRVIFGGMAGYWPQLACTYAFYGGGSGSIGNVYVNPYPGNVGTYQLWYTPVFKPLINNGDSIDTILDSNGWWEHPCLGACIKVFLKENDTEMAANFVQRQADMVARITDQATERDTGNPGYLDEGRGEGCDQAWDGGWGSYGR